MTGSNNPSSPGTPSNVVPMPTNWPGPMFNPAGRSWPQPPSCFSELAALNACYDSVQMMEQILSKVITDLVQTNTAVQQAIVEAIAASGSNVPLIGVTNGSDAQPGQVGQWQETDQTGAITGALAQTVTTSITLPAGDWDLWGLLTSSTIVTDAQFRVPQPLPAGMSGDLYSYIAVPGGAEISVPSTTVRVLTAVPVLIPFTLIFNTISAGTAGTYEFATKARRVR
jgi:hypothetical protein